MIELITSRTFDGWLRALRDRQAKARILARIDRLAAGNPGDVKPIGGGLSEMRIDHGPGYRVYYMQRGPFIVILLSGGDKSSQQSDIARTRACLHSGFGRGACRISVLNRRGGCSGVVLHKTGPTHSGPKSAAPHPGFGANRPFWRRGSLKGNHPSSASAPETGRFALKPRSKSRMQTGPMEIAAQWKD